MSGVIPSMSSSAPAGIVAEFVAPGKAMVSRMAVTAREPACIA
jgi:hypothetical protein